MGMDVDHDHNLGEPAAFFPVVDIIVAEGYKRAKRRKLEVFKPELQEPLFKDDQHLVALISDTPFDIGVPRFSRDDIRGLADFLVIHFNLRIENWVK